MAKEAYKETTDGRYFIKESTVEDNVLIKRSINGTPFEDANGNHVPMNQAIDESVLPVMPEEGQKVERGIIYKFDGKLWGCEQGHDRTHYHPSETPALFTEIYNDYDSGYPEWEKPTGSHDAYDTGEIVTMNGVLYKSRIDANTTNPEDYNDTDSAWDYWNKEPF